MLKKLFLFVILASLLNANSLKIVTDYDSFAPIKSIINKYKKLNPEIDINLFASDNDVIYAQIRKGAKYDIFLTSDKKVSQKLFNLGLVGKPKAYGSEKLVIITNKYYNLTKAQNLFKTENFSKVCIENPNSSIYGATAVEILKSIDSYDRLKDKLIYSTKPSQTINYTIKFADMGIVGESFLNLYSGFLYNKNWVYIDETLYKPLKHYASISKKYNLEAEKFHDFLFSQDTQDTLKEFAYNTSQIPASQKLAIKKRKTEPKIVTKTEVVANAKTDTSAKVLARITKNDTKKVSNEIKIATKQREVKSKDVNKTSIATNLETNTSAKVHTKFAMNDAKKDNNETKLATKNTKTKPKVVAKTNTETNSSVKVGTKKINNEIKIAVSKNGSNIANELIKAFNKKYPNLKVAPAYSNDENITSSILNNTPYQIYLSSNVMQLNRLYKLKKAISKPAVYAKDMLVLMTNKNIDLAKGLKALKDANITTIMVANPQIVPYGKASIETIKKKKIYKDVERKLQYTQNVWQIVNNEINESSAGFIGKSFLSSPRVRMYRRGKKLLTIKTKFYEPIKQGVVILDKGANNKNVKSFYDFILSQDAKKILKKHGYIVE